MSPEGYVASGHMEETSPTQKSFLILFQKLLLIPNRSVNFEVLRLLLRKFPFKFQYKS